MEGKTSKALLKCIEIIMRQGGGLEFIQKSFVDYFSPKVKTKYMLHKIYRLSF